MQRRAWNYYLLFFILLIATFILNNNRATTYVSIDGKQVSYLSQSNDFVGSIAKITFTPQGIIEYITVAYTSRTPADPRLGTLPTSQNCKQTRDGLRTCTISFVFNGKTSTDLYLDFGLDKVNFNISAPSILKEKVITTFDSEAFTDILLLIIIFLPILWATHNRVTINQWLTITLSLLILFRLQPTFTAFLIFFLWLTYQLGQSSKHRNSKSYEPITFILLAVIFLLFFKVFNKEIFTIFANPGSFSLFVPLGISYFIIRIIDTQLKWHRGTLKGINFREYLLFIIFPATIPAGPIETIDIFLKNRVKRITNTDILYGLKRIIIGLFQKMVIADYYLGTQLDGKFFSVPQQLADGSNNGSVNLLILSFLFVYIDFSAYSNIAIGLGRMMGYQLSENFNWPIFAHNPREFWKRWHMTLSNWCMRNIYFPVLIRTKNFLLPSFTVMFVVGMWHAISLSWFLWAIHHTLGIFVASKMGSRFGNFIKKNPHKLLWLRPPLILATIVFISAGHAFAQYSDHVTAINVYIAYWSSIVDHLRNPLLIIRPPT